MGDFFAGEFRGGFILLPLRDWLQPRSFVSVCMFFAASSVGHPERPSARSSCSLEICFSMWHHPLVIPTLPRSLVNPTFLFRAPLHLLAHDTALELTPLRVWRGRAV